MSEKEARKELRCSLCYEVIKPGEEVNYEVDTIVCGECTKFKKKVADKSVVEVIDLLLRTAAEGALTVPLACWLEKYANLCNDKVFVERANKASMIEVLRNPDGLE